MNRTTNERVPYSDSPVIASLLTVYYSVTDIPRRLLSFIVRSFVIGILITLMFLLWLFVVLRNPHLLRKPSSRWPA